MTNDYKDKILKYLTGNLNKEPKSDTPYPYEESEKVVESSSVAGQQTGKILCKDSEGNNNGKYLTYLNGKIFLYDETNNLIHTYTKYSSGTNLDKIQLLNVDEQGNAYGVENYYNGQERLNRIILLNNLSEKAKSGEYQCILRQSYIIQRSYSINTFISINKSNQSASYLLTFQTNSSIQSATLGALKFVINVGSTNEWTDFNSVTLPTSNNTTLKTSTYNYFDSSDSPVINLFAVTYSSTLLEIHKVINNDTSLSIDNTDDYKSVIGGTGHIECAPVSANKMYFILFEELNSSGTSTYKLHFLSYDNGEIFTNKVLSGNTYYHQSQIITPMPRIRIDVVNNIPFIAYNIMSLESTDKAELYFGTFPGVAEYDYLFKIEDTVLTYRTYAVSNVYNIYYLTIAYQPYNNGSPDTTHYNVRTTKLIYNQINYNGSSYENINSLIPSQGILQDNQGNIIFARNLYNYKNFDNYSYSVLNVPNNYLNEIEIAEELLLGKTNTTLIDSLSSITKNVYEDLYINFNNQLLMSNQNESIYVDNLEGAIRLNKSFGKLLDYEDSKANKIRVTYDDDSSYITSAHNTINNDVCTYEIGIHVPNDKNISKIEIISNDELTTYQTINNLNLENNKYYIITQDVYVV